MPKEPLPETKNNVSVSVFYICFMAAEKIIADWKKQLFKPVYWLEGEEPFFIDQLVDYAERHILCEEEKSFNQTVLYGRDTDWPVVVNACMRYPMFAERQLVLLKEAQHMKDILLLENYISKPLASTIFVVAYKEKKLDGRSTLAKLVKKQAYFNSEKIKDYQLQEWITGMLHEKGFTISERGLNMLAENIGNDLSRLYNEVDKIALNLKLRKNITENDIEEYVGISREFNVFELQDAVAQKNLAKAIRIIRYFESNPKAAPIQLILPALYTYFSKIYTAFALPDRSEASLRPLFYNNFSAARQALATMNNYDYNGIEKVLLLLHQYNLKSIGVGSSGAGDAELLKEMVVKMIV